MLVEELRRTVTAPSCTGSGRTGGVPFRRGTLLHLLRNRIYIGKIVHKGIAHDGEHAAIVPIELWDLAQALLTGNRPSPSQQPTLSERSLLAGRILDGEGRRMTPSHTVKGSRRYRYYVTHARELVSDGPRAWRIAAHDLESLVIDRVGQFLSDRRSIADLVPPGDASALGAALTAAPLITQRLGRSGDRRPIIEALVDRVQLASDHVAIDLRIGALHAALGSQPAEADADEVITLVVRSTRVRQAKDIRLIIAAGDDRSDGSRNEPLVALLGEARAAYEEVLASPERSIAELARDTGRCRKRLANLLRIALLPPDVVEHCLDGTQPATLTTAQLFATDLPVGWPEQRHALGIS